MSANNKQTKSKKCIDMNVANINKFVQLLYIQSTSNNEKLIYKYLVDWLDYRNIHNYTDEVGNIIAVKGKADFYPCICSHMDTVHTIKKEFKIFKHQNTVGNTIFSAYSGDKQVGIGGDDKCGIFACLYMLENIENIKVIFFTQEEVGLIGSSDIDKDIFNDVGYIIQLDRWGNSDFISVYGGEKTVSDDFLSISKPILKQYGYKITEGLITDSINLFTNNIGVSCINISCGYYQHHTSLETIDINELNNSILFAEQLIKNLGCNKYEKMYINKKFSYYNKSNFYNKNIIPKNQLFDDFYDLKDDNNIITSEYLVDNINHNVDNLIFSEVLKDLCIDENDLMFIRIGSKDANDIIDLYLLYTNENLI